MKAAEVFLLEQVPLAGSRLVEASAGTGKTFSITGLVLRLLLEQEIPIEKILVVTFTQAATAELKDRIRSRLEAAWEDLTQGPKDPLVLSLLAKNPQGRDRFRQLLSLSLNLFDQAQIYTIHGFCHQILQEFAFEAGLGFERRLVEDHGPILRQVVQDFWASQTYQAPADGLQILSAAGWAPEMLFKLAEKALRTPLAQLEPQVAPDLPLPDRQALDALSQKLAQTWQNQKIQLLESLPLDRLKGGSFDQAKLSKKASQLEAFWQGDLSKPAEQSKALSDLGASNLADKTKKGQEFEIPPFFFQLDQLAGLLQNYQEEAERWLISFQTRFLQFLKERLAQVKEEQEILFFDDMLLGLHQALQGEFAPQLLAQLARRYQAALIDEFQDTDPLQTWIFQTIFTQKHQGQILFLIGDPKQAIYSFRGADLFAYLKTSTSLPQPPLTMVTNWRSDPGLLAALNHLYGEHKLPFVLKDVPYVPVSPKKGAQDLLSGPAGFGPLELHFVRQDDQPFHGKNPNRINKEWALEHLAQQTAQMIQDQLEGGWMIKDKKVEDEVNGGTKFVNRPLGPQDIAVLVRGNDECQLLQDALEARGIKAVIASQNSVFASEEAEELLLFLHALLDSSRLPWIRTSLLGPLFGLNLEELEQEEFFQSWLVAWSQWREVWRKRGIAAMLSQQERKANLAPRLLAQTGGERSLTNFLQLKDLLHQKEQTDHLPPEELLRWAELQRQENQKEHEQRLETDQEAVKVMTIHRSKGLEFGVVYLPFLWLSRLTKETDFLPLLHDDQGQPLLSLHPSLPPHLLAQARQEALAEESRLLYVALTRAKHQVRLFFGPLAEVETSALAHLFWGQGFGFDGQKDQATPTKSWTGEQYWQELQSLPGLSLFLTQPLPSLRPWSIAKPEKLAPPRPLPQVMEDWSRTGSYSSLAKGGHLPDEAQGPERQDPTLLPDPFLEPEASPVITLLDLPKGPKMGNCFHQLLEELDFTQPEGQSLAIATNLKRYNFDPEQQGPMVQRALQEILACPWGGALEDFSLNKLPQEQRINEMEFLLPLGGPGASLKPAHLARLFQSFPSEAWPSQYPQALQQLEFFPIQGFLKGFIDLVLVWQGKYYLVDYKTNHLGERLSDYARPRVQQAMAEHHYYLQYHLYALALHRTLGQRLPGYSYDLHFGGVYYLFVKAMRPPGGQGVFFDRPSLERITALGALLDQPQESP